MLSFFEGLIDGIDFMKIAKMGRIKSIVKVDWVRFGRIGELHGV